MRAIVLSAVTAIALSACGGGGSTTAPAVPGGADNGRFIDTVSFADQAPSAPLNCATDGHHGVATSVGPYQYNAGTVPADDTLWINAVAKVSGATPGTEIAFYNVTYSTNLASGSTPSPQSMPNMTIFFDSSSSPSVSYTPAGGWVEHIPASLGGNVFLDGYATLTQNSPYRPRNGTLTGCFASNSTIDINFQFGAALYGSAFPQTDYNSAGAKPADQAGGANHAGTPENEKSVFIGGAGSGGGGSNYTGSYSATGHVRVCHCTL
ncbi:MAG TPA: hypothetical protein VHS78_03215 [Candidatus Elarobacter sp.]|nr:hypothetical protein [Candidatus Elarobacter sp.]